MPVISLRESFGKNSLQTTVLLIEIRGTLLEYCMSYVRQPSYLPICVKALSSKLNIIIFFKTKTIFIQPGENYESDSKNYNRFSYFYINQDDIAISLKKLSEIHG
ncbi:hypothetical protein DMB77_09325 [Staphylococcus saccharolyticus]|nr:hypothetical protein DMB74_09320 [Staphylococcus saccharolyticus]TAA91554.1 hypothetical protein DMB77_09325 [Staphylococcus saccharolyticus]